MDITLTTPVDDIVSNILSNQPPGWLGDNGPSMKNVQEAYRQACTKYLETVQWDGSTGSGKGIVTCAGGNTYFPCVWVLFSLLRKKFKCDLPIEMWHIGPQEVDDEMRQLLKPLDITIRDAAELKKTVPCRILNGWELKTYAIKNSGFKDVLYLDADNVPLRNPDFLFDTLQYKQHGAIMWGDFNYLSPQTCIIFGVQFTRIKERETGQLVFNKDRIWKALMLAHWYNENSDFYYKHVYGDKECIHMGFRRTDTLFADPPEMIGRDGIMSQHDFEGNFLFHHRNRQKWIVDIYKNKLIFPGDDWCLDELKLLANQWSRTKTIAPEYYVQHELTEAKKKEIREEILAQNPNLLGIAPENNPVPATRKIVPGCGRYVPPEDIITPLDTPTIMADPPTPQVPNSTSVLDQVPVTQEPPRQQEPSKPKPPVRRVVTRSFELDVDTLTKIRDEAVKAAEVIPLNMDPTGRLAYLQMAVAAGYLLSKVKK
jgi:Mannosyltransferase putative